MKKKSKRLNQLIGSSTIGLLMNSSLIAATPVWTFSAPNPAQAVVTPVGITTVQYTITNQSARSKYLTLKATAGLSASPCYLAGKGSTCLLTITAYGNQLPAGGIHTGPVLCEQGNSNQCYQPTAVNQLSINPMLATIAVTGGAAMTLNTNDIHAVGWMVVQNNSSALTATNIKANLTNTPLNGHITQDASDCLSVAPGASCTLRFSVVGNSTVPATDFNISGDNTAPTRGQLTISAFAAGLAVGDNFPTASSSVGKIASLNVSPTLPTACGTIPSTLYLVTTPDDYPTFLSWDSSPQCFGGNCTLTNATDITNGFTNTQTIVNCLTQGNDCATSPPNPLLNPLTYAAGLCATYEIDEYGHSPCEFGVCYQGWYLPAQTELFCLHINRGVIGGFDVTNYWTSVEFDQPRATNLYFTTGNINQAVKSYPTGLRCVRSITN